MRVGFIGHTKGLFTMHNVYTVSLTPYDHHPVGGISCTQSESLILVGMGTDGTPLSKVTCQQGNIPGPKGDISGRNEIPLPLHFARKFEVLPQGGAIAIISGAEKTPLSPGGCHLRCRSDTRVLGVPA